MCTDGRDHKSYHHLFDNHLAHEVVGQMEMYYPHVIFMVRPRTEADDTTKKLRLRKLWTSDEMPTLVNGERIAWLTLFGKEPSDTDPREALLVINRIIDPEYWIEAVGLREEDSLGKCSNQETESLSCEENP